ncbi:MAG: methylated-DNA--[protein]-cysteine S-methyltransferase [Gemmatimonadetes bacterium]|nr:MAG: methylated-DNA--[protein]-cysteine S-methyltransferase [Gemmatimonadota bacterium]
MLDAFMRGDAAYEGIFFTGVRTTGIFCRPTCPARRPRPHNVVFFPSAQEALASGFRPCLRCRPLEPAGATPGWLRSLLERVEADPSRRWTDADLRALGLTPERVRRWFQRTHGMTFHAYQRARRLGLALGRIQKGGGVAVAAFEHGYDSLSAFNEAFRRVLGAAPSTVRDARRVAVRRIATPLGPMVAGADERSVLLLEFHDRRALETQVRTLARRAGCTFVPGDNDVLRTLEDELRAYFEGGLRRFEVPCEPVGTPFQQAVWRELRSIPYGETRSYGDVAAALGRPAAVRAVARANGANRLAVLVPCHRVVGSDGRLTGYGGGLWRKQRLLDLERGAV